MKTISLGYSVHKATASLQSVFRTDFETRKRMPRVSASKVLIFSRIFTASYSAIMNSRELQTGLKPCMHVYRSGQVRSPKLGTEGFAAKQFVDAQGGG